MAVDGCDVNRPLNPRALCESGPATSCLLEEQQHLSPAPSALRLSLSFFLTLFLSSFASADLSEDQNAHLLFLLKECGLLHLSLSLSHAIARGIEESKGFSCC